MKNNQTIFLFIVFLIAWGIPQSAMTYEHPYQIEIENQDHNWLIQSRIGEVILQQNNKTDTLILAENRITSRSNRRRCRGDYGYSGRNHGYRKGYRDGFSDGYRGRYYRWSYSGHRDIYGEKYYGEDDSYQYNRRSYRSPYYPSIYDRRQ